MNYLPKFFKTYAPILAISIVIFVVLESIIAFGVDYLQENDVNSYKQINAHDSSAHIKVVLSNLNHNADIFYHTLIDNPEMIDIMEKASETLDKKELSELRTTLYEMYKKKYRYLKSNNVRQLHFHLKDSVSFLRFHRPSKFGDSLKGVREDIEFVNQSHMPLNCFTEGRVFNGFRNVYPIFKGKKFVGTVEISYLFSALQEELLEMTRSSYLFMVSLDVVGKKVYKNERFRYKQSEFENFDYDVATLHDLMEFRLESLYKINREIAQVAKDKLQKGELFAIKYSNKTLFNGRIILASFVPIKNLENKTVAYVIQYEFGNYLELLLKKSKMITIILSIVALLLSIVLFLILFYYRKKHKEVEYLATHDALTKLYNRHGANALINQKIDEYMRFRRDLSLIFFDIDFFKRVNDTYGHDIGDYVLENIAKIVNKQIRTSDIIARWGGEEFIIVLPETTLSSAEDVAHKLRREIEFHVFYEIDKVTCSFGVVSMQEGDTKESFFKRADDCLYSAKEKGRNCVVSELNLN